MKLFQLAFENKPFIPDVPKAWLEPATAQVGTTLEISVTEYPGGPFAAPALQPYRFEITQVVYAFTGDHNGIVQTDATPVTLVLRHLTEKAKKS